ncbi:YceI family protein [Dyadobacter luticola]|nr:YceI family protein [Dyadobacter luticola]
MMRTGQIGAMLAVSVSVWNCTDHAPDTANYKLNDAVSVAEWKGYLKTGYFNEGSITVKSESLVIRDGQVKSGSFTIPVSSILNFNLPTDELKHQLVHHLQSPDFFNMALHPDVKFEISNVSPFSGTGENVVPGANFQVTGNLTMLGKTNLIVFAAKIDLIGDDFKLEALAPIDRTKWGMNYATESNLPDDASIKPVIDVHLKLSGKKL